MQKTDRFKADDLQRKQFEKISTEDAKSLGIKGEDQFDLIK